MEEMKIFNNSEFGTLEVITVDGKEYFPATDCAKMLGYENPRKAISDHCKTPGVTIRSVGVQTGVKADGTPAIQNVAKKYITEGNLYRLITHSKLPSAEKFESWIFDEVIPEIRRTGGYTLDAHINNDMAQVVQQAVASAVSETIKQLMPLLMNRDQTIINADDEEVIVKPRRRMAGTIEKLPRILRDKVDDMLFSTASYREIQLFLKANGVEVSQTSICRYARHLFNGEF
ncbi:MAG: BRO family protein [Clostridia bacterium]|nr:BRO family protein [Clostridia bacterium]